MVHLRVQSLSPLPHEAGLCTVLLRGPIEKVDNIVPVTAASSLALSQDRKIIIWTIGTYIRMYIYQGRPSGWGGGTFQAHSFMLE